MTKGNNNNKQQVNNNNYNTVVEKIDTAHTGWYNDDSKIHLSYQKATMIGDFNGGKLYGFIPTELDNAIWHNALEKGFVRREKGTNGVKFENGVIELKIDADARLYTTIVHKNDKGDYLAIFDDEKNHKEIAKLARKTKATKIVEDCVSKDTSHHDNDHSKTLKYKACSHDSFKLSDFSYSEEEGYANGESPSESDSVTEFNAESSFTSSISDVCTSGEVHHVD